MKIKLKSGDKEIEVEGSKSEIDQALANWWNPSTITQTDSNRTSPIHKKNKARGVKNKSKTETTAEDPGNQFDPVALANAIKEHPNHEIYELHILHKPNLLNKILLICAHETNDLTSGEITKALKLLDVKIDQGNLSNALKTHSGKFLSTGARRKGGAAPKYRLTSKAKADFTKWISEQNKS